MKQLLKKIVSFMLVLTCVITMSPVSMHIPQELRIRSGGTERHSASN